MTKKERDAVVAFIKDMEQLLDELKEAIKYEEYVPKGDLEVGI